MDFLGFFLDEIGQQVEGFMAVGFAVIAIVALIECFFGFKLMKLQFALIGFVSGAAIGTAIGIAIQQSIGVTIAIALVLAIVLAILLFKLYLVGVFISNGALAFLLIYILSRNSGTVGIIAAAIVGIIVGIVAVKLVRIITILTSGVSGGITAGIALGGLIGCGQGIAIIIGAVLAALGCFVQFRMNPKKGKKSTSEEDTSASAPALTMVPAPEAADAPAEQTELSAQAEPAEQIPEIVADVQDEAEVIPVEATENADIDADPVQLNTQTQTTVTAETVKAEEKEKLHFSEFIHRIVSDKKKLAIAAAAVVVVIVLIVIIAGGGHSKGHKKTEAKANEPAATMQTSDITDAYGREALLDAIVLPEDYIPVRIEKDTAKDGVSCIAKHGKKYCVLWSDDDDFKAVEKEDLYDSITPANTDFASDELYYIAAQKKKIYLLNSKGRQLFTLPGKKLSEENMNTPVSDGTCLWYVDKGSKKNGKNWCEYKKDTLKKSDIEKNRLDGQKIVSIGQLSNGALPITVNTKSGEKVGCINISGKVLVPFEYDAYAICENGYIALQQDDEAGYFGGSLWGKDAEPVMGDFDTIEEVLQCYSAQWYSEEDFADDNDVDRCEYLRNGYYRVWDGAKDCGLMNNYGDWIIPADYDGVEYCETNPGVFMAYTEKSSGYEVSYYSFNGDKLTYDTSDLAELCPGVWHANGRYYVLPQLLDSWDIDTFLYSQF